MLMKLMEGAIGHGETLTPTSRAKAITSGKMTQTSPVQ
jgi:hypothetical protein